MDYCCNHCGYCINSGVFNYFLQKQPRNNILNVTPKEAISLFEIANIINKISDFESNIIIKNHNLGNEYTGNNSKLLKEIPNLTFTPYKKGLNILFNDLKDTKNLLVGEE